LIHWSCDLLDDSNEECIEEEVEEEDDNDSFDWQIDQHPFKEDGIFIDGPKYGFANKRCGVLKRLTVNTFAVLCCDSPQFNLFTVLKCEHVLSKFRPFQISL